VAALVHSDARRPRSSVLAEPTPESLHNGGGSPVIVVIAICSTHTIAVAAHSNTSSTYHNQIISQHQRTRVAAALHATGHRQKSPRTAVVYTSAPQLLLVDDCTKLFHNVMFASGTVTFID
jgi:hypothetical protein